MYYSGHGSEGTGGWEVTCKEVALDFDKVTIYLNEVLDIFVESKYKGLVEVSSDSCYSGWLSYIAKEYVENHGGECGTEKLPFLELKVSGSAHRTLKAKWGEYRKMKSKCMKDGNTKEEFIIHQKEYE